MLLIAGCATAAPAREDQIAVTHRRADDVADPQRVTMACIAPPDATWVKFCAQRAHDRERAEDLGRQQAQWDRENAASQAAMDLQRQQIEMERRENARRALVDIQKNTMPRAP